MIERILNRLFAREEMDGNGRCPTYLVRWTLLKIGRDRGVYLHHFVGDDWCLDLHDHPKRFISIGLWVACAHAFGAVVRERTYRAPWIRTFPAHHVHRIRLINRQPCWTLVIVLKSVRPWGFWHAGHWIPWRQYVASDAATHRRSCP